MARSHLLAWNIFSTGGAYRPYRHASVLCSRLMDMLSGHGSNRLIVQVCPQHGKSSTATEGLATFFLGNNPGKRVGICSYSADLAESFGYRNRVRMEEYGPAVFGIEPEHGRRRKSDWCLAGYPDGGMVSVGVGGPLTGKRLDMLICDDLIKNSEEAMSPTIRDSTWNWLATVAMTRLSRDAPVVLIGARWHPDDYLGRLIRQSRAPDGVKYDIFSMPAIAVEDEPGFRKAGEPLCPELHPLEKLLEIKKYMSPFQWSALYQQEPLTPEGSHWPPELFNDRVFVDDWPSDLQYLVMALDPSSGRDQKRGDYPAVCALGTRGDGLFYMDFLMERATPHQVASNLADYVERVRQRTGLSPMALGVEKQGLWELYAEKLVDSFHRAGVHVPICEVSHQSKDKCLRIQRLDPFVSSREIRFIRSRGTMLAIDQFRDFPNAQHDDGPDAAEMAFRIFPIVVESVRDR